MPLAPQPHEPSEARRGQGRSQGNGKSTGGKGKGKKHQNTALPPMGKCTGWVDCFGSDSTTWTTSQAFSTRIEESDGLEQASVKMPTWLKNVIILNRILSNLEKPPIWGTQTPIKQRLAFPSMPSKQAKGLRTPVARRL